MVSEKMAIFDKYMVSSDCRYTVDCVLRVIIIIIIIIIITREMCSRIGMQFFVCCLVIL